MRKEHIIYIGFATVCSFRHLLRGLGTYPPRIKEASVLHFSYIAFLVVFVPFGGTRVQTQYLEHAGQTTLLLSTLPPALPFPSGLLYSLTLSSPVIRERKHRWGFLFSFPRLSRWNSCHFRSSSILGKPSILVMTAWSSALINHLENPTHPRCHLT